MMNIKVTMKRRAAGWHAETGMHYGGWFTVHATSAFDAIWLSENREEALRLLADINRRKELAECGRMAVAV